MTEKSISNKLSELFDLYKSGALTKEEYERLKRQILSNEGVNIFDNGKKTEPENAKSTDKSIQIIPQERGDKVENGKTQEPEITKSTDKSISRNKASRIWILAIISIVIIATAFFVFKTNLFPSKSGLIGQHIQTVKDVEGNVYKTVTIGTQVWMAENLKTTKYNDGTTIPLNPDVKAWEELTTPAYCWYDNDETANKDSCGALYNWHTVSTNKLCPTGWHVSTIEEWTTLITYLGGEEIAGGKLKETGTFHWKSPNTGATNETGFTALPGGYLHHLGTFKGNGGFNFWWTASLYDATHAWNTNVSYNHSKVNRNNYMFQNGLSVRCLKDLSASINNESANIAQKVEKKYIIWDEADATQIIMDELSKYSDWSFHESFDLKDLHHKFWKFQKIDLGNKELMVGLAFSELDNHCPPICNGVLSVFEFENRGGWILTQKAIGFSSLTPKGVVSFNKMAADNYEITLTNIYESGKFGTSKSITLYTFINEKLMPTLTWERDDLDTIYNAKIKRAVYGGNYYVMLEEKAKAENIDTIITKTVYTFNGTKYEKFNGTITDPSLTSMDRFYDINTMEQRKNNVCSTCNGTGIQICYLCGGTGVNNMGIECGCIRTFNMELAAGHEPSHPPLRWTCLSCNGTGKPRN